MITDPSKLPPVIECLDCGLFFSNSSFLWHACGEVAQGMQWDQVEDDAETEDDAESEDDSETERDDGPTAVRESKGKYVEAAPSSAVCEVLLPSAKLVLQPPTVELLPFNFLPPGQTEIVEQFRSHMRRTAPNGRYSRHEFDWSRYYRLKKSLNASVLALGVEGWWGYAVYQVPDRARYVLDSIVTGNAAYVIEGEWRQAIHYSKAEIRQDYRLFSKRVVHRSDWVSRISEALGRRVR